MAADMLSLFVRHLPGGEEPGRFYNFHVLVHVIMQIRWFGSLILMSANRWESTHSSVKKLYRATRRHTRTLATCMSRAHSNQTKAAFLCQDKSADKEEDASDVVEDDSDVDENASYSSDSSDDSDDSEFERKWTKVSKATNVTVGDVGAVAKFTFQPEIAEEFWRCVRLFETVPVCCISRFCPAAPALEI